MQEKHSRRENIMLKKTVFVTANCAKYTCKIYLITYKIYFIVNDGKKLLI